MTYKTTTTLNEIRSMHPCEDGWAKLLKGLGKTKADDESLELRTILDINGLDDALWCLQVPSLDRLSRHVQAAYAERVLHIYEAKYPNDTSLRDQIAMLRNDDATSEQRDAAWDAAWDAARGALEAARDAREDARAAWAALAAFVARAVWAASNALDAMASRDASWSAKAVERAEQERILREMLK